MVLRDQLRAADPGSHLAVASSSLDMLLKRLFSNGLGVE